MAMVGNPPPAPPSAGVPEGQPVTQPAAAGFGGGFTPSPQIYVGYTFWSSLNGVPVNPETGQLAEIGQGRTDRDSTTTKPRKNGTMCWPHERPADHRSILAGDLRNPGPNSRNFRTPRTVLGVDGHIHEGRAVTAASPPTEPPNPSGMPCPGCGRATAPGSTFCASCGRPLTNQMGGSPWKSRSPTQLLGGFSCYVTRLGIECLDPSIPRPPGAPWGRADLPSRPLSVEERDQILRLVRSPGASAAGAIGLFAGLAALTLSVTELLGVSYDPTNFFVIVLGASMIALVAGGVALGIVRPPRGALRYGRAIELNGIPTMDSLKVMGHSGVQMGPIRLMVPKGSASAIRMGDPQGLVVALGVPPMRTHGFGIVPRGVLLQVNGSPLPKPPIVFVTW